MTDLKAISSATFVDGDLCILRGYRSTSTDGNGTFIWDSSASDSDNGGTIITPDDAPASGRWLRIYTGGIDPHWFGCYANGSDNDDTAFGRGRNVDVVVTHAVPADHPESGGSLQNLPGDPGVPHDQTVTRFDDLQDALGVLGLGKHDLRA